MSASPLLAQEVSDPLQEKNELRRLERGAQPLGTVLEVSGLSVWIGLDDAVAATVQLGEFVSILTTHFAVIGEVTSFHRRESTDIEVRLVASIDGKTGEVYPGIRELPMPAAAVHRASVEVVRALLEGRSSVRDNSKDSVVITLGASPCYPTLEVSIPPEKLFARHLAVVGSSGAGKSCTIARIIEESLQYRSKIVLLDLTGEYRALSGPVAHTYIGPKQNDLGEAVNVALPFYEMSEADLISILGPETPLQLSRLQSAIRTLKLINLEPRLSADGVFRKAHRDKAAFERALEDFKIELEQDKNLFDIYKLPLQIEAECVEIFRSQSETNVWGGPQADEIAECSSLIHRANEFLRSGESSAVFMPKGAPSLMVILGRFLKSPDLSLLRISFESLPSRNNTREFVAQAIARELFAEGKRGGFRERPVLLVVDEAHHILRKRNFQVGQGLALDAFQAIAKEGRKYGIMLCISTQRSSEIPDDIMCQMGSFIVHRLLGKADRDIIERASGTSDKHLLEDVAGLSPGEGFLVGAEFSGPIRLHIKLPQSKPMSQGPDFCASWRLRS